MKKIRASLLPTLFACEALFMEKWALDQREDGESNQWADTGNIYHALAAAHHKKRSIPATLKIATRQFKLGDPKEALRLFETYKSYAPTGAVIACETQAEFEYKGVTFTGTCDLVIAGTPPAVYDHKTGKKAAVRMKEEFAPQLAVYGYHVYVTHGWWPDVYINHARQGRMIDMDLTLTKAKRILDATIKKLERIERAQTRTPGPHCRYCTVRPCDVRQTDYPTVEPIGKLGTCNLQKLTLLSPPSPKTPR